MWAGVYGFTGSNHLLAPAMTVGAESREEAL